jgi:hypothetical protein
VELAQILCVALFTWKSELRPCSCLPVSLTALGPLSTLSHLLVSFPSVSPSFSGLMRTNVCIVHVKGFELIEKWRV